MARYLGPSCRQCRREGIKLFLKGRKCNTPKCPVTRRAYAPGQHGQMRIKLSNYGLQLREKQKAKRIYGVLEKQFRRYFSIAAKSKGVTGKVLLQLLESRMDNLVFRTGFATSRPEARQIVRHGHTYLNNRRINIPSAVIKKDDIIQVKGKEDFIKQIRQNIEESKDRGLPTWLEVDFQNLKAKVVRLPEKEDLQFPIQEQLIVELYSK